MLETADYNAATGLLASLASCTRGIQREELIRATRTLASRNQIGLAKQCVEEMERSRMRPSLRAYNGLLRAHASQRNFGESTQLLVKMRQASLTPNADSYTLVMRSVLGVPGGARLAEHLLPELEQAQQREGQLALPVHAGGRMNAAGGAQDATAMARGSVALAVMGRDPLGQGGLRQLQERIARGEPVSARAFAAVVQGCAAAGKWRQAMQVVGMLEGWLDHNRPLVPEKGARRQVGPEHDSSHSDHVASAFAAAIAACSKGGRPDKAASILERMEKSGINPTVDVFDAAILACRPVVKRRDEPGKEGEGLQMAELLFHRMRKLRLQPQTSTYNAVLAVMADFGGMGEKALDLLGQARSERSPVTHHISLNRPQPTRAYSFTPPPQANFTPNVYTFSTAITACFPTRLQSKALRLTVSQGGGQGFSRELSTEGMGGWADLASSQALRDQDARELSRPKAAIAGAELLSGGTGMRRGWACWGLAACCGVGGVRMEWAGVRSHLVQLGCVSASVDRTSRYQL